LGQNVILFTTVSEAVLIAIASAGRVLLLQKSCFYRAFLDIRPIWRWRLERDFIAGLACIYAKNEWFLCLFNYQQGGWDASLRLSILIAVLLPWISSGQ
tara:strand:+ start:1461 stop:1757 length:297 start_codon:yes stop_codon:yes gene_type:complete